MEKEPDITFLNRLSAVPDGRCLNIRHLSGTEAVRSFSDHSFDSGTKLMTETYTLYPGISLAHHWYLASRFPCRHMHGASVLSMDHCRRGRIGWEMKDGLSLYFGSGDLSFHFTDKCSDSVITLPLGYYEGLTLTLDLDILCRALPEPASESGMDIRSLCGKFCGGHETASMPVGSRVAQIFSDLYDLLEESESSSETLPLLKLKCQELLLCLDRMEPCCLHSPDAHCSGQVDIIRRIHDTLTAHPEKRFTIDELSRRYLINTAALKSVFKSVYGMPVASYMKQFRITRAAQMLRETDESIASVARAAGYESQSKFTAAFKDVMKILPTDYRRQYHD